MPTGDRFVALGNYIEAGLWAVLGLVFVGHALRQTGIVWKRCWQAAVAFILFGCSDVVEAHTGAWWRPWWLLVWKGLCILGFLALLIDYRRRRRASESAASRPP